MSGAPIGRDERSRPAPLATGVLAIRVLLASLSMLFAASLMGYLAVRGRAETWPPPGMPAFPRGLWLSTVLMVVSSLTVQWAKRAARRDHQPTLRAGLLLTLALGLAFLTSQTVNWFALMAQAFTPDLNLYAFTFYLLTVLHAVHVVGGLIPLGIVTARAWRGSYSAEFHPGVDYIATYWHFLDVVWLVLFAVLSLAG